MWAGLGYYRRARFLLEVQPITILSSWFHALFFLFPLSETVMHNFYLFIFNQLILLCPSKSRNMFSVHLQVTVSKSVNAMQIICCMMKALLLDMSI